MVLRLFGGYLSRWHRRYQDQGLCLLALLRSRIPNSHCRKPGAVHGWNVYGRPANSAGTARRLVALSCLSDYGRLQYSIRPADTPASQAGTLERAVFLDRDEQLRSQKAGNHVEARS